MSDIERGNSQVKNYIGAHSVMVNTRLFESLDPRSVRGAPAIFLYNILGGTPWQRQH